MPNLANEKEASKAMEDCSWRNRQSKESNSCKASSVRINELHCVKPSGGPADQISGVTGWRGFFVYKFIKCSNQKDD